VRQTRIFFAPFHAASSNPSASACGSAIGAFHSAVNRHGWPYDHGDDPAFYAARKFENQLSWGVCRQDVRNQLSSDDIVVFFSFCKLEDTGESEYRLCALATVKHKVRQTDLWQKKDLRIYRKYFNLLVRPSRLIRGSWDHFEPTLGGQQLHNDWLWRIADHRGLRKKDFEPLQETNRFENGAAIRGRALAIAQNYVIFSSDPNETYILSKPPVIAWHSRGKPGEEWNTDKFSQGVRRITLDVAARANGRSRSLRIKNSQRAHRHIVFELPKLDADRWRAEFLILMRDR
jgi:hypothetical protein